jgi:hypothetical protein
MNDEWPDQFRAARRAAVDLGVRQADVFASFRVVGGIETARMSAPRWSLAGIATEAVVEAREIRQVSASVSGSSPAGQRFSILRALTVRDDPPLISARTRGEVASLRHC